VQDDVDVWRYAILELYARNDDVNMFMLIITSHKYHGNCSTFMQSKRNIFGMG